MLQQAEKDNAAIQSETAQVLGSTAVNYNSEINRYASVVGFDSLLGRCGNTEIVETAEEMIARAKRAKKAGRVRTHGTIRPPSVLLIESVRWNVGPSNAREQPHPFVQQSLRDLPRNQS